MRQTLLLIAAFEALDVLASNSSSGNATTAAAAATTAAAASGNTTATTAAATSAATTAAGTAAATTAAGTAAATTAAAAAGATATTAAASGNTTKTTTTDNKKLKFDVPMVKVKIDFTVLTTAALKTSAAKAIFDGVKEESCLNVAKFASVAACDAGVSGKSGKLYAKFDSEFGTLTDATMSAGYDTARRLASHMKETTNDFKFVLSVPAAQAAAEKTAMNTELGKVTVFNSAGLANKISAKWTAAGVPGNATITFVKPTMTAADSTGSTTTTTTSGAAQVTGLFALVLAGAASLF